MKKSLCLSTLFFGLVTSSPALEIRPVLPAWFVQKQSDLETIAIAPRWFLEEHTASLMRDYFGEETAALPLKAVLPPWFAKQRAKPPELDVAEFARSIGNIWRQDKKLAIPTPPPEKRAKLSGGLPDWYTSAKPRHDTEGLLLPSWFRARGTTKTADRETPPAPRISWLTQLLDNPLAPTAEDLSQKQDRRVKNAPPGNYVQLKAALEPHVRMLEGEITIPVSANLHESAIEKYLGELMFDWIIKSYHFDYDDEKLHLRLVYYDWYRCWRGAQNPEVWSELSERDRETVMAAWALIDTLASSGGDRDRLTLIKGFHDFLVASARYSDRPRYRTKGANLDDYHQTPDREAHSVLVDKEGICESYASAFQLMCRLSGVECILVHGKGGKPAEPHAWNMVRLGGRWRHIDVTFDDPLPDSPEEIIRDYFMLTDSQIRNDHEWDSSYPRTN